MELSVRVLFVCTRLREFQHEIGGASLGRILLTAPLGFILCRGAIRLKNCLAASLVLPIADSIAAVLVELTDALGDASLLGGEVIVPVVIKGREPDRAITVTTVGAVPAIPALLAAGAATSSPGGHVSVEEPTHN